MVIKISKLVMFKYLFLCSFVIFLSLKFCVAATIDSCGDLDVADETYILITGVSSTGTCFNILADNITLDCTNHAIYYSVLNLGYGVNNTGFNNFTLKNCIIIQSNDTVTNSSAVYFESSDNNTLMNNTITTVANFSFGIYSYSASDFMNISDNNITTSASGSHGIFINNSLNSNLVNNNITTTGSGLSSEIYGIGVFLDSNYTKINNNIFTTSGTVSYGVYSSDSGSVNVSNNLFNFAGSYSWAAFLYYSPNSYFVDNNIITSLVSPSAQGVYFRGSENSVIARNDITSNSFSSTAVTVTDSVNSTAVNNILNVTNTNSYGVLFSLSANSSVINNTIFTSGASSYGINIGFGSNSNVTGNNVTIAGSSSTGIGLDSGTDETIATDNIINATSDYDIGVFIGSNNIIFDENFIFVNGTSAYGLQVYRSNNSVSNNNITTYGSSSVFVGDTAADNVLINNNIYFDSNYSIFEDVNTGFSQIIYNNSYGQIYWNLSNLTTKINLSIGGTIFLEDNNVGLINDANAMNLNSSANVTFYGLSYSAQPWLMKDGVRCDDDQSLCNITSWDGSTLVASVNSFSNYTTFESGPICGDVRSDITLTNNVSSTGTCFTIVANDVVLDCDGSWINYSTSDAGYGILNSGYDNVTIKNCNIIEGSTVSSSPGIRFTYADNSLIDNTTVFTSGSSSRGLYFIHSSYNNITNVVINTSGSSGFALDFAGSSSSNRYENGTIYTYGANTTGLKFGSATVNTTIVGVNISTYNVSSNGIDFAAATGILVSGSNITANDSNSNAIYLNYYSDDNIIMNSYISSRLAKDIFSDAVQYEDNYIVNSTFNSSNYNITGEGKLYAGWFAAINVTNTTYYPLENVLVKSIASELGSNTTNYQNYTSSLGLANLIVPSYYIDNTGKYFLPPNYIRASVLGYSTNITSVNHFGYGQQIITEIGNTALNLTLTASRSPYISLSVPVNIIETGKSVLFSCSATHAAGVASISIRVGSSLICSGTSSCSGSYSASSSYTVSCSAVSNDGDAGSESESITVIGDKKGGGNAPSGSPKQDSYFKPQDKIKSISSVKGRTIIVLENGTAEFGYKDKKPVLNLNLSLSELVGNYNRPDNVFISFFVYIIAVVSFVILLVIGSFGVEKAVDRYKHAESAYTNLKDVFSQKTMFTGLNSRIRIFGAEMLYLRNILQFKGQKSNYILKYAIAEYKNELFRRLVQLESEIEKKPIKDVLVKIKALENLQDSIRGQLSIFDNRRLDKKIDYLKNRLSSNRQ
jgi:hypothetical protein